MSKITYASFKKQSEEYARFVRDYFPLFEEDQLLAQILMDVILPGEKFLFMEKIIDSEKIIFKEEIYRIYNKIKGGEKKEEENNFSIEKILQNKGKIFYCQSTEEVESFKKYYNDKTYLCTFRAVESRMNNNHIFFYIADNVKEDIPQEPGTKNDEFDLSVICMQICKKTGSVTMIGRYNHFIQGGGNPNCTLGNNLDSIANGLSLAILKQFNISIRNTTNTFKLPTFYWLVNNDKPLFMFSPREEENTYIGWMIYLYNLKDKHLAKLDSNHYRMDGKLTILDKSRYCIVGTDIADFKEKKLFSLYSSEETYFPKGIYLRKNNDSVSQHHFIFDEDEADKLFIYHGNNFTH